MEDIEYENICVECSQPFFTKDEDMNYCPDCWAKKLSENLEIDTK